MRLQGCSCSSLHCISWAVSAVSGAGCSPREGHHLFGRGDVCGYMHTRREHGCPHSPCWQIFALLLSRGHQPSWGHCGEGCAWGVGRDEVQGKVRPSPCAELWTDTFIWEAYGR